MVQTVSCFKVLIILKCDAKGSDVSAINVEQVRQLVAYVSVCQT